MNRAWRRAAKAKGKPIEGIAKRGPDTCPRCGPSDGPWLTIARREGLKAKIGRAHECGVIVRWEKEVELPGDLTDEEYRKFLNKHMPAGRQSN